MEDVNDESINTLLAALLCIAAPSARAETIDVSDNHGGRVAEYDARWAANAPQARFGFHLAHLPQATVSDIELL